jgi:hypothetical protein
MLRLIKILIKWFRQMRAEHQLKFQQLLARKGVALKQKCSK